MDTDLLKLLNDALGGYAPIVTAILAVLLTWYKMKQPANPTPSPGPLPNSKPDPLPTPAPNSNDPFGPLPGLPGHPFLNGLVTILPWLKLLLTGAAAATVAQGVVKPQAAGLIEPLTQHEDSAIQGIASVLKSSPAAVNRMRELLA